MNYDALPFDRLSIVDKSHHLVPLRLNAPQQYVIERIRIRWHNNEPVWVLVLKGRQWGSSTFWSAVSSFHCAAEANAHAAIVAHQQSTSTELYEKAVRYHNDISAMAGMRFPKPTKRELLYPHPEGYSKLTNLTAGSITGGHGLTFSCLILSEASRYKAMGEPFDALLNTVPDKPGTILAIESTANGMDGPGYTFYDLWMQAVEGRGNFLPIFVSYLMDSDCRRPAEEAADAPRDEDEKRLMKAGATLEQIAFRRWAIFARARGDIAKFNEQYPETAEMAFMRSGDPAFTDEEIKIATEGICKPTFAGMVDRNSEGKPEFKRSRRNREVDLAIWKWPEVGHRYVFGADAARGLLDLEGLETIGDFAAAVFWDMETGEQAARFAARIGPREFADICDLLGRFYNRAMFFPEVTGGDGNWLFREMRDVWRYPNLAPDWGKDDRLQRKAKTVGGFETTFASRNMMYVTFRESLRARECVIHDEVLLSQMRMAVRSGYTRWEVEHGHDDVFCLEPNTEIVAAFGRRRIGEIVGGDSVLSHAGQYRRVTKIYQRPFKGSIITLEVVGNRGKLIRMTPEHPVLCRQVTWNKAGLGNVSRQKRLYPPVWAPAGVLRPRDFVFVPKRKGLKSSPFEDEVLWLMGWYLAEGCVTGQVRKTGKRNLVQFSVHENEFPQLEKLAAILVKYDPPSGKRKHPRIRRNGKQSKGIGLQYRSDYWAKLLIEHCGLFSYGKQLSEELFLSSGLLPLVRGWIEGDGCQTRNKNTNHHSVTAMSVSEALTWQMRQILLDNGIWCTMTAHPPRFYPGSFGKTKRTYYRLYMTPVSFPKFGEGYKIHPVVRQFEKAEVITEDDGYWVPIRSVGMEDYDGDVFNLEVEEDHTYVAGGIAVHNCAAQIGWLARTLNYYPMVGKNFGNMKIGDEPVIHQPSPFFEREDHWAKLNKPSGKDKALKRLRVFH